MTINYQDEQPLPVDGLKDVTPALIDFLLNLRKGLLDPPLAAHTNEQYADHINKIVEALNERLVVGIKRYGKPLQTFNGRNALQDVIEEKLDDLQYSYQLLMERKEEEKEIWDAYQLVRQTPIDANAVAEILRRFLARRGLDPIRVFHTTV